MSISPVRIHSHNDYRQLVPFYQAYSQQVHSIEADLYLSPHDPEQLVVAHDKEELQTALTFEQLYLQPLVDLFRRNNGKAWVHTHETLDLLIDIKSNRQQVMDLLVKQLEQYPEVFNPFVNPLAVRIVISGDAPAPEEFDLYPAYIFFDGLIQLSYTPAQLNRVAFFSESFRKYSVWNGKGSIIAAEKKKLEAIIQKAHAQEKPIRFWGSPDSMTAWNTFYFMGIDYINTDKPEACSAFFRNFDQKNFALNTSIDNPETKSIQTDRLDKITARFTSFSADSRHLAKAIEIYKPTFLSDGKELPVKNVILLIGDGMGLAQVCVADAVNHGLSMLQLKQVGLQRTQAKDAYTTDSAGAGSSLATGESNNNRHISMSKTGEVYETLVERFTSQGKSCGVVTFRNIADATPAAFYSHTTERDRAEEILPWLTHGALSILCGSGIELIEKLVHNQPLEKELTRHYDIIQSIDSLSLTSKKVLCIDERMGEATTAENLTLLADATRQTIGRLEKNAGNGFFLMVEGAKIDYAGHANSLPNSVMETLGFDLAVAEALKFADENGETLVIVTADHETGGLTLVDGNPGQHHMTAIHMTDDHTPIMVPVFAYGPQSQRFTGVYPNTHIFHKIIESTYH
ncbi:MAG: alkaline phosphatase [Tannerellaceae bacterium]|nr:alkaline phosphatase [Tannerellaceae bacterium]